MRPRPSRRRNSGSFTARYFCRLRNVGQNKLAERQAKAAAEKQGKKKSTAPKNAA
jgi:hypothetical protein